MNGPETPYPGKATPGPDTPLPSPADEPRPVPQEPLHDPPTFPDRDKDSSKIIFDEEKTAR
jgi:hypothetical protein